jgi:uncharacterized sporulation protein YeaH/YhbH (DUF444 family)
MAFTYEELKGKTVAELREIAAGTQHEAVQGYTQLNKDHLLAALCKALDVDVHARHKAKGTEKLGIRAQIKAAKKVRDEALASRDRAAQRAAQKQIHDLKRAVRKLADVKPAAKGDAGK